jgi:hypothetical protein
MTRKPDPRCRHGLAGSHARALTRQAAQAAIELERLAACETGQANLHRALAALRTELATIERLASEFECADNERSAEAQLG